MGKLISRVKELARAEGKEIVYISTDHEGLYEKYGAVYMMTAKDRRGGDSRIYRLDTYGFYGWQEATVPAKIPDYPGIHTPRDLYNRLWDLWCADTCAPRMRGDWRRQPDPGTVFDHGVPGPGYLWRKGLRDPASGRRIPLL